MFLGVFMYDSFPFFSHPMFQSNILPFFLTHSGGVLATILYIVVFDVRYRKIALKNAPNPTPPEARLEMMMVCAPLFIAGFFIFGWTSYPT